MRFDTIAAMGKTIAERTPEIRQLLRSIERRANDRLPVGTQIDNLIGVVVNCDGVSYDGLDHDLPPELMALIDPILSANGRSTLADVARWFRSSASKSVDDMTFYGVMYTFTLPNRR